jgi:hypothetical protein
LNEREKQKKKKACEQVLYCRDRIGVDIPTTRTNARLVSFLKDMLSEEQRHKHTRKVVVVVERVSRKEGLHCNARLSGVLETLTI